MVMQSTRTFWRIVSFSCSSLLGLSGLAGCLETYDPPPGAAIDLPESGAFALSEPVTLSFSEPIDPQSLGLNVWRPEYDQERNLTGAPIVDSCTLAQPQCAGMTLEPRLAPNGQVIGVSLTFDQDAPVLDGKTYILEIQPGLEDLQGRQARQALTFNFQYALPKGGSGSLPAGLYTLSAYVEESGFKIPLNLVCDVTSVMGGDIYFACIKADPRDPATTQASDDPAKIQIAPAEKATWTAYFKGTVSQLPGGDQTIETQVISFFVPVFGSSAAELVDGKLQLRATGQGEDIKLAGSLIHQGGYIHSNINRPKRPSTPAVKPGSAVFTGQKIRQVEEFDGHASVCGDQCGRAGQGGYCKPIEGFPEPGVCP